jgi:pimeloyl-ACP methyl ester carboxylesterase
VETTPAGQAFRIATMVFADVGSAEIAFRQFGVERTGPPLLLIHGWPLSGFTWRHCIAGLAHHRRCIVTDSPGAGDTRWNPEHDFRFRGQAEAYARFIDGLGIDRFDILAHDTGATIARELALIVGERVGKLVMINTEIPGHRPPWIGTFQKLTRVPGAVSAMRLMLRSRAWRRSGMGFGGCFVDKSLLDGEFHEGFVRPMLASKRALDGQIRYLHGIDWALVDSFVTRHREIAARVLFVWGIDDPTFPVEPAREMASQFARADFVEIPDAKLLVHEERPEAVVEHVLAFLASS